MTHNMTIQKNYYGQFQNPTQLAEMIEKKADWQHIKYKVKEKYL